MWLSEDLSLIYSSLWLVFPLIFNLSQSGYGPKGASGCTINRNKDASIYVSSGDGNKDQMLLPIHVESFHIKE